MLRFLASLLQSLQSDKKTAGARHKGGGRISSKARPELEALESRLVPTVTFQGGAVLNNVDVQPLYLGVDWKSSATVTNLNNFVTNVVQSSYLPMLGTAGYGTTAQGGSLIGKGTYEAGKIDPTNLNKSQLLTDSQIQTYLQTDIQKGILKSPNAQNLYIVYVEDNVAVQQGGQVSTSNFYAYHQAFPGKDASGHATVIHYAVIDYPGGTVGNLNISWLKTFDVLTLATSHELAEAVTDPNVGPGMTRAWTDLARGEIGDIVAGQTVYLNGYAVQEISDQYDQAMVPAGATTLNAVSFVLQNGTLLEHSGSSPLKTIATGVKSLSDQGIDDQGVAMVDYVTTGGTAYEYHDGGATWIVLGTGVQSAMAGDGVSYVGFQNGTLKEYHDATSWNSGAYWTTVTSFAAGSSMSAGTDREGVNTVIVVNPTAQAIGYSDAGGIYIVASLVNSVSAGQQGYAAYVTTSGFGYTFHEGGGGNLATTTYVGGKVTQITAGTDANGNALFAAVFTSGTLEEEHGNGGWAVQGTNGAVKTISKGRAGLIDLIFSNGNADEWSASGLTYLTNNVSEVG